MYNKKIAFYRKRNMLTQEELAYRVGVSRQTITKWEAGIIAPGLDYLIKLSDVLGVTVDTLIKDDYHLNDPKNITEKNMLIAFLVKAKQATYAAKKNKIQSIREMSHDYCYQEEDFMYYDSFFGDSIFSGQEIVYQTGKPCWSLNYYGRVLDDDFNGDFLKAALLTVNKEYPYRGDSCFRKGEYLYVLDVEGDICSFNGNERIYYQNKKVYKCLFHGGILK